MPLKPKKGKRLSDNLPDVQNGAPGISVDVNQVGVENVQVPFQLESRHGEIHEMVARVSMRTNLCASKKGISMSRLHLTLHRFLDEPLKSSLIVKIMDELRRSQEEECAYMTFKFKLPMSRKSPITDHSFPIYYDCKFEGHLTNNSFKFFQGVRVQYASYCPCSARLSKDLREKDSEGFPHAQRSFADVLILNEPGHYLWLEDIIETIEGAIKTLPYPIIKRVDEQEIARIAANNPIFVEDAIRQISKALGLRKEIKDWIVKCTHEESIHTSEAIAIMWKGLTGGFDGRQFL